MRLHTFVRLNPLRIYIHQDSVVRLASEKYLANGKVENKCMHITNQAYQTPKCPKYIKNTNINTAEQSHLWNLKTLLNYIGREYYGTNNNNNNIKKDDGVAVEEDEASLDDLLSMELDNDELNKNGGTPVKKADTINKNNAKHQKLKYSSPEVLWEKIQELVVKSILASDEWREEKMKYKHDNGFSFLGPDVAIDNEGVPFLLEINAFPTTSVSTPLGVQLKLEMLTDMYRMLGVGGYNDVERKYSKYVKDKIERFCTTASNKKRKQEESKVKTKSKVENNVTGKVRRRQLLKQTKKNFKNTNWWCTKKEIQILMQYEDEKAYSGSWELAFPTRIGLLDTYQSIKQSEATKKWVPGHYNNFLWDYILSEY
jgi:hypothetical protein